MATLATETWTGTTGAAWPSQWTVGAAGATGSSATIQSNAGRLTYSTVSGYSLGPIEYLSGMAVAANFDITLTVTFASIQEEYLMVGARSSADGTSGYGLNLYPANGTLTCGIVKFSSTGPVNLGVGDLSGGTWTAGVARKVRFQCIGSTLRCKVWDASTSEPTSWLGTVTDTTYTGTGKVVLWNSTGNTTSGSYVTVDDLFVTDGTTSPPTAIFVDTANATIGEVASATSVSVNVPTGVANGDLLMLSIASGASTMPSAFTGWTQVTTTISPSSALSMGQFYRVASSEPASYTFTGFTSGRISAEMVRITGVDSSVFDTTPQTVSSTVVTASQITTVSPNALIFYAVGLDAASAADLTVPSGVTAIKDSTGTGKRLITAYEIQPSAGTSASRTFTETGTTGLTGGAFTTALRVAGPWINRTVVQAAPNGTSSNTVSFTAATAGNFLVAIAEGAVTSTTPTGWTLPTNGSAVSNTGLYVWTKTAASGESSFSTTHNGSNYPTAYVVYEFPAGATLVTAASAISATNGSANPAISSLTGTNHLFGVMGMDYANTGDTATSTAWTASAGTVVDDVDVHAIHVSTDGYVLSVGVVANSTATSFQPTPTLTTGATQVSQERLTFAISTATGGGTPTDSSTLAAAGQGTSSLTGTHTVTTSVTLRGTATASMSPIASHSGSLTAAAAGASTIVGGIGQSITAAAHSTATMTIGHTVISSVTIQAVGVGSVAPLNATSAVLSAFAQGISALYGVTGNVGSVRFTDGGMGLQFLPAGFGVTAFGSGAFGGHQITLLVWQWTSSGWQQLTTLKTWNGTAWVDTSVIGF